MKIKAKIVDFVSEITVTPSYVNMEINPVEVVYMFLIEEKAAVTTIEAKIDDRIKCYEDPGKRRGYRGIQ